MCQWSSLRVRTPVRRQARKRILAVAMATHPRLGADSRLGRLFPDELFRDIVRTIASHTPVP